MSDNRRLTPKQKLFADYYIETGNATWSAKEAGYSENSSRQMGSENLSKPYIKRYIDDKMKKMADKRILGQREALEILTSIARGEMIEEQFIATVDGLEHVEKTPDIKDRQKAIDSLLKRYPISKYEELRNEMVETQIKKLNKELDQDVKTEDKLIEFFDLLDGEFYGKE